jgi:cobalt/nickel transport system ATP-binding protein
MLFNPTVRDEIAYGPRQLGLPDAEARVARWAAELQLSPLLDQPPFLLSGGEKQKLALASLLAIEPQLLLLDEPSASLDPATVGWLIDTLLDSNLTIVAATHNLSLAAELGSRCLVLGERGRLLYDGPVGAALGNIALLEEARLAHRHRHRHGGALHSHVHVHDWEGS